MQGSPSCSETNKVKKKKLIKSNILLSNPYKREFLFRRRKSSDELYKNVIKSDEIEDKPDNHDDTVLVDQEQMQFDPSFNESQKAPECIGKSIVSDS